MRLLSVVAIVLLVAGSFAQDQLKIRVGILQGQGWEKIRSGDRNRDSFRELIADILRKDGRFEVVLLKPLGPMPSGNEHLMADLFIDPVIFSAKQETNRQRVPNALERIAGGAVSGSVATSTAEVEVRLLGKLRPNGNALFEAKGFGKHSASQIDAYNRDTGHVDIGDLRKTDSGAAVERAVQEALKGMPKDLAKAKWKAVVAAVQGDKVIINRGKASGLKVGMEFRVVVQSPPLLDPVTNQVLAEGEEKEVARIRVTKVDENATTCAVISGSGIEVMYLVCQ